MGARSSVGFDAVAQGEAGAGVDGVGVVEDVAEFGDRGGVAWCGQWVETDVQGVGVVVGDDVAGAGQRGADQGVGFVVGAGVAGVGDDGTRQGLGGVVGGDADGVVDQFGFGVEDLLTGVDLGEREPGGECLMRGQCRVERGLRGVQVEALMVLIIALVSTTEVPGSGELAARSAASLAFSARCSARRVFSTFW